MRDLDNIVKSIFYSGDLSDHNSPHNHVRLGTYRTALRVVARDENMTDSALLWSGETIEGLPVVVASKGLPAPLSESHYISLGSTTTLSINNSIIYSVYGVVTFHWRNLVTHQVTISPTIGVGITAAVPNIEFEVWAEVGSMVSPVTKVGVYKASGSQACSPEFDTLAHNQPPNTTYTLTPSNLAALSSCTDAVVHWRNTTTGVETTGTSYNHLYGDYPEVTKIGCWVTAIKYGLPYTSGLSSVTLSTENQSLVGSIKLSSGSKGDDGSLLCQVSRSSVVTFGGMSSPTGTVNYSVTINTPDTVTITPSKWVTGDDVTVIIKPEAVPGDKVSFTVHATNGADTTSKIFTCYATQNATIQGSFDLNPVDSSVSSGATEVYHTDMTSSLGNKVTYELIDKPANVGFSKYKWVNTDDIEITIPATYGSGSTFDVTARIEDGTTTIVRTTTVTINEITTLTFTPSSTTVTGDPWFGNSTGVVVIGGATTTSGNAITYTGSVTSNGTTMAPLSWATGGNVTITNDPSVNVGETITLKIIASDGIQTSTKTLSTVVNFRNLSSTMAYATGVDAVWSACSTKQLGFTGVDGDGHTVIYTVTNTVNMTAPSTFQVDQLQAVTLSCTVGSTISFTVQASVIIDGTVHILENQNFTAIVGPEALDISNMEIVLINGTTVSANANIFIAFGATTTSSNPITYRLMTGGTNTAGNTTQLYKAYDNIYINYNEPLPDKATEFGFTLEVSDGVNPSKTKKVHNLSQAGGGDLIIFLKGVERFGVTNGAFDQLDSGNTTSPSVATPAWKDFNLRALTKFGDPLIDTGKQTFKPTAYILNKEIYESTGKGGHGDSTRQTSIKADVKIVDVGGVQTLRHSLFDDTTDTIEIHYDIALSDGINAAYTHYHLRLNKPNVNSNPTTPSIMHWGANAHQYYVSFASCGNLEANPLDVGGDPGLFYVNSYDDKLFRIRTYGVVTMMEAGSVNKLRFEKKTGVTDAMANGSPLVFTLIPKGLEPSKASSTAVWPNVSYPESCP
jgi:hypothetical protein